MDNGDIDLITDKTSVGTQLKCTTQTTFAEVLQHDLSKLERCNITNLKKEVICDIAVYVLSKLYKQPKLATPPIEHELLSNIKSACDDLKTQIAETEAKLLERSTVLEESFTLCNKLSNTQINPSYNLKTTVNKDVPKNVNLDHIEHIDHHKDNALDEDTKNEYLTFFQNLDFKMENGHGVCSFGEEYKYTNSKSNSPAEMPPLMKKTIEDLAKDHPEASRINQCLVNKLEGPESYISVHCDDESTIAPGSNIYTFSLGDDRDVRYTNLHSGEQQIFHAQDRSLYIMSRKSQAIWSHAIEKSAVFHGVRYSITFRVVGKQYHNSTVIMGDSNTKFLKFGKGNGTFGYNMPGERIYAPRIEHLDAQKCIGYNNIIIHCGINDIKDRGTNIPLYADRLINKIERIRSLCPKSIITINPLLPTKSDVLNTRAKQFNKIILDYIDSKRDYQLHYLNFDIFADEQYHLLKDDLGRFNNRHDHIHLGSRGVRLLVQLIKERVCGSKVDGRLYASVSSMNSGGVNRIRRVGSASESMNRGRAQNGVSRSRMNMMATTSDTLSAPSQQLRP